MGKKALLLSKFSRMAPAIAARIDLRGAHSVEHFVIDNEREEIFRDRLIVEQRVNQNLVAVSVVRPKRHMAKLASLTPSPPSNGRVVIGREELRFDRLINRPEVVGLPLC